MAPHSEERWQARVEEHHLTYIRRNTMMELISDIIFECKMAYRRVILWKSRLSLAIPWLAWIERRIPGTTRYKYRKHLKNLTKTKNL